MSANFDPGLCAAPYNRLIQIGFEGSHLAEHGNRIRTNWLEIFRDDPSMQVCEDIFPEPLISFLGQVNIIVDREGSPKVFDALLHHIRPLPGPSEMLGIGNYSTMLDRQGFIILFPNNVYSEHDCAGVVMDLLDLSVCNVLNTSEINPDDPNGTSWYTLEDYLVRSNCIVEIGKYKPVVPGTEVWNPSQSTIQRWDVTPWNDFILRQSLDAWDLLIEAISARLPNQEKPQSTQQPIADDSLPNEIQGFPRAFLSAARKPAFEYIAPGLTIYDPSNPPPLPRRDPQTMRYNSPNPDMFYTMANHDALILFPAAGHAAVEAGLWISPDDGWADTVRLALPYQLRSHPNHKGEHTTPRRPTHGSTLWQHGECPFFIQHATRLVTMLYQWRKLIEEGIWTVNERGVADGIDFYQQAEDAAKGDWFCLRDECFDLGDVAITVD